VNEEGVVERREGDDEEIRLPAYEKRAYQPVFGNPNGTLSGFREDYYLAARAIGERITEGKMLGETEGIAALFLFRHYLELALKTIIFGLRRLETRRKNVPRTESVQQASGHNLGALWAEIKKHHPLKMGQKDWNALDTAFLDQCIYEFARIDPSSERFRYPLERKGPSRDRLTPLAVAWDRIPRIIEHAHDVLETMDTRLVETYAQNEEWEAEMNSW
jgi:hypothetical protein